MTKTLEERAHVAKICSPDHIYTPDEMYAYEYGYKEGALKELQAVLDEAKKYEIKMSIVRPFVYLEDLEFIIKDRMK